MIDGTARGPVVFDPSRCVGEDHPAGGVSSGGYTFIFWLFQNPLDLLFALIKVMTMATAIIFVGCYYGYTAGGGPIGVGRSTARSMMLNMLRRLTASRASSRSK